MITFILPGYSAHNKEWAEEVAKNININGVIKPIFWDHWSDESKSLKPSRTADLISEMAKKDEVNIIAKSVGTLVASYVAQRIGPQIRKLILCGVPSVSGKRLEIYKRSFGTINPKKITVFQNVKDPFASFLEVKSFIAKLDRKIKVIEKPRSDHSYPYYEDFTKILSATTS